MDCKLLGLFFSVNDYQNVLSLLVLFLLLNTQVLIKCVMCIKCYWDVFGIIVQILIPATYHKVLQNGTRLLASV